MSYILDALRRAESERQRGQVPGIGAAPLPVSQTADATGSRGWRWIVPVLLLLAAAGAMLWWLQQPPALPLPARPLPPPVLQQAPVALQTAPAPALVPVPAPVAPAPLPRVVSAPPPAAAPPTPVPVGAEPSAPADPDKSARPLRLVELSPQQRSEWPAPSIGGSVWSDSAPSRFVILNGQVMREGQTVSPGLVLERIQPRSALLRWRGLLVEVPL